MKEPSRLPVYSPVISAALTDGSEPSLLIAGLVPPALTDASRYPSAAARRLRGRTAGPATRPPARPQLGSSRGFPFRCLRFSPINAFFFPSCRLVCFTRDDLAFVLLVSGHSFVSFCLLSLFIRWVRVTVESFACFHGD